MKKRTVWLIVATAVLLIVTVGITLALLISSSDPVVNTFTVGDVGITLNETTGSEYKMAPGIEIFKDPTITVEANSEKCYLYVKLEKSSNFNVFCSFEMADGWNSLPQNEGVYYRMVEKSGVNRKIRVIKNDRIYVNDALTEDDFNAIIENPTLKITAYAIQSEGMVSELDAWRVLNERKEE